MEAEDENADDDQRQGTEQQLERGHGRNVSGVVRGSVGTIQKLFNWSVHCPRA
jgi:hypothetical protein